MIPKYRYWYSGEMVEVGKIEFFVDGQITINDELVGGKLMMWTGLKDKNGKEIYEGDILKYSTKKIKDILTPVSWIEDIAGFGFFNEKCQSMEGKVFEIIGNIYENPELLK